MNSLARALEQSWQRRGWLNWILRPVAMMFRWLVALRLALYRIGLFKRAALPVPVIVVGNITVGGSGKTPLVIALTQMLQEQGWKPGIVSRGYGGSYADQQALAQADTHDARRFGDEAVLMAQKSGVPVFVGRKRAAAARLLLERYPATNLILCDDGLQHYVLQRDIELALFDNRGIGNGWMLPAGPLREPVSRLVRTDAVILNGENALRSFRTPASVPKFSMRLQGSLAYPLAAPAAGQSLSAFKGKKLIAAAGIGNPQRFFRMLREAQLEFVEMPLPDHHDFHDNPFAGQDAEAILVTEKDAVKCKPLNDARIWVVPVAAQIDPALIRLILERLARLYPQLVKTKTEKTLGPSPA